MLSLASFVQIRRVKWREIGKDYFTFSFKDRVALVILLSILLGIISIGPLIRKVSAAPVPRVDTALLSMIQELNSDTATLETEQSFTHYGGKVSHDDIPPSHLFYFDPNNTSHSQWKTLGLNEKTITTIEHYIAKGGKFRNPDDLQRIYGLHGDQFSRLRPFIRIEERKQSTVVARNVQYQIEAPKAPRIAREIDINEADSISFMSLPGIGNVLANRITHFREKLGGFYSIDQIKETYGLPDSTFQRIKPALKLGNTTTIRLDINNASLDQLKSHPYIRWNIANAIISYRKEHGAFKSVDELKNIMLITDDIFQKIKNYILVN
jgi:competence protein ComEA